LSRRSVTTAAACCLRFGRCREQGAERPIFPTLISLLHLHALCAAQARMRDDASSSSAMMMTSAFAWILRVTAAESSSNRKRVLFFKMCF